MENRNEERLFSIKALLILIIGAIIISSIAHILPGETISETYGFLIRSILLVGSILFILFVIHYLSGGL